MQRSKSNKFRILQIAHGKIIPPYSSAYSLRCERYLSLMEGRLIMSVGGLVFKDKISNNSEQYHSLLLTIFSFLKGGRVFEINLSSGKFLRKKYAKLVRKRIQEVEIVIFEGPWQFRLFEKYLDGKKIVYDAHNVESVLRSGDPWEKFTFSLEKELLEKSDLTITVTEEDKKKFIENYRTPEEGIVCIPEGFEPSGRAWSGHNSRNIVFIGSAYVPNIRAAERVIEIAGKLPDFNFKIIGSVCSALKRRNMPNNVVLMGTITEDQKDNELTNAFLAINPVDMGSGRNLKMNDYIGHGVPTLTTEIGARGFSDEIRRLFFVMPVENFHEVIPSKVSDISSLKTLSNAMIEYARRNAYSSTMEQARDAISKLLQDPLDKQNSYRRD